MARLSVVVGLPGSGKTHYLRQNHGWRFFDDFKGEAHDDCPRFTCSRHFICLTELLRAGRDWAISDIRFCEDDHRAEVDSVLKRHQRCCPSHPRQFEEVIRDFPAVEVEWVFFENAPEKCRKNVTEPDRLADIDRFTKCYHIPGNATPVPVWEKDKAAKD